jgi:hypothetical protein
MPLPIPNLDDRTFDQLAAEARALIPRHFPQWTDHNTSDPGITLLELFAFLTEAACYQIDRVPERTLENFAGLVNVQRAAGESIDSLLGRAADALESRPRAITGAELEGFASGVAGIARSKVVVALSADEFVFPADEIVQLVVVPNVPTSPAPVPTVAQKQAVFQAVVARCPITTRLRVLPPSYTSVAIDVTIARRSGSFQNKDALSASADAALRGFLSPLTGGEDGAGWEFGRAVFRSELHQVIESLEGIDHTARMLLNGDENIDELVLSPDPRERAVSLAFLSQLRIEVVDR